MKDISKEFLDDYLPYFIYDGVDSLFELYKIYSTFEVKNIQDLKQSIKDFCVYILNNVDKVPRKENFTNQSVRKGLESFSRSINVSVDRYTSDNYRKFAQMVYEVSPSKDKEIVLDVGAGRIPSSSIWLGEKVKRVASIDCEFYISGEALEEMNVEATEAYFDKFTSVGGYTFVVGRCPCTAIKYMVQKCANANIPYLIKLCDCDIVAAQRYINKANSWDMVLLGYDENVKFYKDYAYNLDVSRAQLEKLVEEYDSLAPPRARRVKTVLYFDNGNMVGQEEEMIK